jgi:single-strand DNA-binding protein
MNLNKVMLIGRLGKKPEINYIQPDVPVARFSLATTEIFKTKDGERRETTEWHNIVAWRNSAKLAENYLDKGMLVFIEGKLQTRKWDGQDGATRYSTDIVVDQIRMLEKKGTQQNNFGYEMSNASMPAPTANEIIIPPKNEGDPFASISPELNSGIDDDLPF